MNGWSVEFVSASAAAEFNALSADMRAKLQRTFRLVEERGLTALVRPLARPVDGRIWEFRVTGRDGIARSLYAATSGQTLLVLRTFIKKTPKTPRSEIEIAKRRLAEENHAQD